MSKIKRKLPLRGHIKLPWTIIILIIQFHINIDNTNTSFWQTDISRGVCEGKPKDVNRANV